MQQTVSLKSLAPTPGPDTTAWRILHDAEAGVWVDNFDGRWLVQTERERFPGFVNKLAPGKARSVYWRPRDKAASTAPEHVWGEPAAERFMVSENGARFLVDFSAGYSSGIFLDQRVNRKRVADSAEPGQRILNTFAYTGAFSVMAALSGATTTTADLSKTYLDWTWDNFSANDLDSDEHYGVKGDVFQWLRTFARQGRTFHGVILDPPTFSRDKKKTFRTDRDYADLVSLAASVVEPGGWLLCCANTHRLSAKRFERDVVEGINSRDRPIRSLESLPMPPEFHGDDYLKSLWVDVG